MSLRPAARPHLLALDDLRGFAALSVAIMHISSRLGLPHIFGHAYHAVDLFFVLSGFVIAVNYEPKLLNGSYVPEFFYRRIVRIAPMLVLGAVLGYVFTGLGSNEFGPLYLALALLLVPSFALPEMFPLNPAEWSLLFEIIANALHAFCARWLTTSRLVVVVGTLAIVGFGLDANYGHLSGGNSTDTFMLGLWRVLYGYFIGVLIYRLWHAGKLPEFKIPLWLLVALMIAEFALPGHFLDGFRDVAFMIFFGPLIVGVALTPQHRSISSPFSTLLGEVSYPLYLVHWPVLLIAMALFPKDPSTLLSIIYIVFTLGVALALAWASSTWIDRPTRRLLLSLPYRRVA